MININNEGKILSFQDYKDKKDKEDVKEIQEIYIDQLLDEINEELETLGNSTDNKESYIVELFTIRDFVRSRRDKK